jgi:hypothetical protein
LLRGRHEIKLNEFVYKKQESTAVGWRKAKNREKKVTFVAFAVKYI